MLLKAVKMFVIFIDGMMINERQKNRNSDSLGKESRTLRETTGKTIKDLDVNVLSSNMIHVEYCGIDLSI